MSDDLGSRLKRILYQDQIQLEPAATTGISYKQQKQNGSDNPTLAFISKILLDDQEEDDEEHLVQQQSFRGLFHELSQIVSSDSSSSTACPAPSFDIYANLVKCAQALAANDLTGFYALVDDIKQAIAPQSTNSLRRLAVFFLEALIARSRGVGPQTFRAICATIKPRHFLATNARLPSSTGVTTFSNELILRACTGAERVHIVDYGVHCGIQWPSLIKALSDRQEGPPKLKITGIDLPIVAEAALAGQRLSAYAKSCDVQLEYYWIQSASWETVEPVIHQDEVLIVNSNRLRHMKDEWTAANNPRRALLEKIYKMNPKLLVLCEVDAAMGSPFYLSKFKEAWKFNLAKIESYDAWLGQSTVKEQEAADKLFRKWIVNVVACDGADQIEKSDRLRTWDARARRAGFQPFPVDQEVYDRIKEIWGGYVYNENFRCGRDENWMFLGWKDVVLWGMSAWQPSRTLY